LVFALLRIPNALIRENLEETADSITTFLLQKKIKSGIHFISIALMRENTHRGFIFADTT